MIGKKIPFLLAGVITLLSARVTFAQDPTPAPNSAAPQQQNRHWEGPGQEADQRPLFGKITALKAGAMEITRQDGQVVTVKLTDQTEFRKEREKAAASDFKVGDTVMVRGEENPDHTVTAKLVGARTGGGGPGGGPGGGLGGMSMGTLGKDYVVGEVKAIDPPRLSVLRPDNVTQTLELTEETSLRKGRDSVTMADIKVGDHVMARGAVEKDVFVPQRMQVMNPEQWQRIEEMAAQGGGLHPAGSVPAAPDSKTETPAKP